MSAFGHGQNPEGIISLRWIDSTNPVRKNDLVRLAIGTADAAEFPHSGNDIIVGVSLDEGTFNNWIQVATEGIVRVRNSKAGTVNRGDPVILDYTNSGGTVGKVRSAFFSGEHLVGTKAEFAALSNKAVPGSIRKASGTGTPEYLSAEGTAVHFGAAYDCTIAYQIDAPVIGYALDEAKTPNQLFRIVISKQRHIKNNSTL